MSDDERPDDNLPADRTAGAASLDDLVGAYLLDALDPAERAAFEAHLLESAGSQEEVARLRPVVQLLPHALEDADDELAITPSPSLRSRILLAARGDDTVVVDENKTGPTSRVDPVPIGQPRRTTASGGRPAGGILEFARRIGFERIAAGFLALVAAAAIIWAVTLQNRLSDTEDDLDSVRDELALIQGENEGSVQAVVYHLDASADGPAEADGIVTLLDENAGVASINVSGFPPAGDGRAYQLWFLNLDANAAVEGAPMPSITFEVNEDGTAIVGEIPFDAPYDAVAITNEPDSGSPAPTGPVLLLGTRGVAQG